MRPLVLIFVLALTLAACSGEQISEQIAEEAIGGNANVEIEGEGDDVTINIESDEGSISIGSGGVTPCRGAGESTWINWLPRMSTPRVITRSSGSVSTARISPD